MHSPILQPRDIALLRDLFESRIMTTAHVAALHFNNRKEATKKRLQTLKAAKLIAERPRRAYEPAILFLTQAGLAVLDKQGILAEYPPFPIPTLLRRAHVSEVTVRHELSVMDVKAAITSAIRGTTNLSVHEFTTWPHLIQFGTRIARVRATSQTVKPDGFFRVIEQTAGDEQSTHAFFIEIDRSTETQETLANRAACYVEHYRSGSFAVRNGARTAAYREYPFRVLFILKTAERRNNMVEHLLRATPPILSHVWVTTQDEITTRPLGSIWLRPIDYRAAVLGTPHEVTRDRPLHAYRRNVLREQFIENRVRKHRLFEDIGDAHRQAA